jgi:hypothetical protein
MAAVWRAGFEKPGGKRKPRPPGFIASGSPSGIAPSSDKKNPSRESGKELVSFRIKDRQAGKRRRVRRETRKRTSASAAGCDSFTGDGGSPCSRCASHLVCLLRMTDSERRT